MTDPTHDMPTHDEEMLNDGEITPAAGPPPLNDPRYLLLVGGLLLIISMTLGYLWKSEESRRIAAEKQVVEMQAQVVEMKVELDALRAREAAARRFAPLMQRRSAPRPSGGASGGP